MTRLLHKSNWDADEQWYSNGTRVAWYDRKSRNWISYLIDSNGHQQGESSFYWDRSQLEACEDLGHFDNDAETLAELVSDIGPLTSIFND